MTRTEIVTDLRSSWIQAILNHFRDNEMGMLKFNHMFSCILQVDNMFGANEYGAAIARRMTSAGIIIGVDAELSDELEWNIHDLDIIEVAYILDQLEAGNYRKLDDSYDPEADEE